MTGTGFESPAVQHIRVAELDVAYRELGEGDPAVFIHGLGGMSTNWTDLMHALQYRLHCVAVDLPGFGYSEPFDRAPSITAFAQVIGEFIQAKFPGRSAHLFGNSLTSKSSMKIIAGGLTGKIRELAGLLQATTRDFAGLIEARAKQLEG